MYTIVVKIHDPHGWVVANEFIHHNDSYVGFQYTNYSPCLLDPIHHVPPAKVDSRRFGEAIKYWFNTIFKEKKNVLILTETTEEENQELISEMKKLDIGKEGFPTENICIIICNSF